MNLKGMKVNMGKIEKKLENNITSKNKNSNNIKNINNLEKATKTKEPETVTLKQIKEAIQNKINKEQKQTLIKFILTNVYIAISMIIYLVLLIMGNKNIESSIFENDLKIITLCIAIIGILILENAYKKDSLSIALSSMEILTLGCSSLCLIYVQKMYFMNFNNIVKLILYGILGYYILKIIIFSIKRVKKYKKDNNDIKEIVKK